MVLAGIMIIPGTIFGKDIKLLVNNQEVKTQVAPLKENGSTLVPLKVVAEVLGAKVNYDSKNQQITIISQDRTIKLQIGHKIATVNGTKCEIPIPARIINGTTMVPIRFVAEQLDCTTGWDVENNAVMINSMSPGASTSRVKSEIQVPEEYLQDAVNVLKNRISFSNDIEIFTLYAFMNYTGYNEENNPVGFSKVRKSVLQDLKAMNLNLKDNNYYTNKKVGWGEYEEALKCMTEAPNFTYGKEVSSKALEDLPEHLAEFYKEAKIESLYEKYQTDYEKEQEKYKSEVYEAIAKMNYYLKIDNNKVEPFAININMLNAYWRGSRVESVYYHDNMPIILAGPTEKANISLMVHEHLHSIITPIVNQLTKEIDQLSYLRKEVPKGSQADGYGSWESIVDESIIRGIEGKAANDDAKDIAKSGYNQGFILAQYFYERFDEFASYEGSLEDFIKKLIVEYK